MTLYLSNHIPIFKHTELPLIYTIGDFHLMLIGYEIDIKFYNNNFE